MKFLIKKGRLAVQGEQFVSHKPTTITVFVPTRHDIRNAIRKECREIRKTGWFSNYSARGVAESVAHKVLPKCPLGYRKTLEDRCYTAIIRSKFFEKATGAGGYVFLTLRKNAKL